MSLSQIKDRMLAAESDNVGDLKTETEELFMQFVGHIVGHIAEIIECVSKEVHNQLSDKENILKEICITAECFDYEVLQVISKAMQMLGISDEQWQLLSYEECFAYYAYSQKKELYSSAVLLLDYQKNGISARLMDKGRKNGMEFIMENDDILSSQNIVEAYNDSKLEMIQQEIISWLNNIFRHYNVCSVYLTGKGFDVEAFPKELINFLCTRRKVFAGQNLYVKGACYCALAGEFNMSAAVSDKVAGNQKSDRVFGNAVLACKNRVTTGIELNIKDYGKDKRMRLIKPGVNWYMARRSLDFILDDVDVIKLVMVPCDGSGEYYEEVDISKLPFRQNKQTRINMTLEFTADGRCAVNVKDKGFGEFVRSSGIEIFKEIQL